MELDLQTLALTWPLPGPFTVREQSGGINNLTRRIDTSAGSYFLRLYRGAPDLSKVRYELDILVQLAACGLPFAVPAPVPTRDGDPLARLTGTEGEHLAILTPLIPGALPDQRDAAQARACGEALGELTQALARIRVEQPAGVGSYGLLRSIHPLVPDPAAVPAQLPIPTEQQERLRRRFADLLEQVPAAYAALPRQVIHGDYVHFNLLMAGGQVSGVLDFEIACRDPRALDLAIALASWPYGLWGTGAEWPILDAFGQGYCSRQQLTAAEIAALPLLIRLRRSVHLLHQLGRYLEGIGNAEVVQSATASALQMDDWLAESGDELVRCAQTWGC